MQDNHFSVQGYFEHAVLEGNFDRVRECLEVNRHWGAEVLGYADEKARIIEWVRLCNKLRPSRIRGENKDAFLAVGTLGKKQSLVYRVEKQDQDSVKIIPMAYLEPKYKVGIALILVLFYIVPVLLAPIIWRQRAEQNLRLSRYYLVSFCHHLENQLV